MNSEQQILPWPGMDSPLRERLISAVLDADTDLGECTIGDLAKRDQAITILNAISAVLARE